MPTITVRKDGKQFYVRIPKAFRDSLRKVRKYFQNRKEAAEYAAQLQMDVRREQHDSFFRLESTEQAGILRAYAQAENAENLHEAVQYWKNQRPADPATLKELAIRCVASKQLARRSDKHCKELQLLLQAFILGRETVMAHDVKPSDIEEWLHRHPEWSQFTRLNYLRKIRTMFSFGVKNGLCKENPAEKVEMPVIHETAPAIMTPEQAETLLRKCSEIDAGMVYYFAVCLFAGLRPTETRRLTAESIRDGLIDVSGKRTRARNRRFATVRPTLASWIERYRPDFELVNFVKRFRAVAKACSFPWEKWPQDIMRHSWVSYHMELYGPTETSVQAGHSEKIMFAHYRNRVTRADADRFWSILPP